MSMTLLTTQSVVTGGLNAWTISSISQAYETLLVRFNVADSTAGTGRNDMAVVFNSDSTAATNYNYMRFLFYDGTNKLASQSSTGGSNGHAIPGTGNGSRWFAGDIVIPQYASSAIYKACSFQGGYASATNQSFINNVSFVNTNNTSPVASITAKLAGAGTFAIGSTISIYGLN